MSSLLFDPADQGRVGAGGLLGVGETDELGDQGLLDCVQRAFARMVFPAPEGSSVVSVLYPFTFRPGDNAAASPGADGGAAR